MALAGPLVNVVIVVLIFSWAGVSVDLSTARLVIQRENSLATQLATVNVWLALFDLIPAFPMDGGRVLRALIALKLPYGNHPHRSGSRRGIRISQEAAVAGVKDLSGWLSVSDAMVTDFASLRTEATVVDAAEALLRDITA